MYIYLVFAWSKYYPSGGHKDLISIEDNIDDANNMLLNCEGYYDNASIVRIDTVTMGMLVIKDWNNGLYEGGTQ